MEYLKSESSTDSPSVNKFVILNFNIVTDLAWVVQKVNNTVH